MTERQCPLCHIHAIQPPHGQCANANCPPFEGWPDLPTAASHEWVRALAAVPPPVAGEPEPSPASLVEVETVNDAHADSGEHPVLADDPDRPISGDGVRLDSSVLLPKVELMPAPQPIRTLGETLGNILKAATERADKLAQKVQASSDELHKVMDATEEVSQDMDRVTADMKTKLGLGGNGGPAL